MPLFSTESETSIDPVLEDFQFASAFGQPSLSSTPIDTTLSLLCPDGSKIEVPPDLVSYQKTKGLLSLIEDKAIQDVGTYIQRKSLETFYFGFFRPELIYHSV